MAYGAHFDTGVTVSRCVPGGNMLERLDAMAESKTVSLQAEVVRERVLVGAGSVGEIAAHRPRRDLVVEQ